MPCDSNDWKWKPESVPYTVPLSKIIWSLWCQPLLFFPTSLFLGSPNPTGRQTNETPQTQEEEDLQITGTTPSCAVFIKGTCTDISVYRYWYSHCYINIYTMADSYHRHRVLKETVIQYFFFWSGRIMNAGKTNQNPWVMRVISVKRLWRNSFSIILKLWL